MFLELYLRWSNNRSSYPHECQEPSSPSGAINCIKLLKVLLLWLTGVCFTSSVYSTGLDKTDLQQNITQKSTAHLVSIWASIIDETKVTLWQRQLKRIYLHYRVQACCYNNEILPTNKQNVIAILHKISVYSFLQLVLCLSFLCLLQPSFTFSTLLDHMTQQKLPTRGVKHEGRGANSAHSKTLTNCRTCTICGLFSLLFFLIAVVKSN